MFRPQQPLSLTLLAVACFVIVTILISLQFPAIMSSPWAALSFAACFTAVLGSTATIVGDEIAPLPLYALIVVSAVVVGTNAVTTNSVSLIPFIKATHTMLPISWPVSVVIAVILSILHIGYRTGVGLSAESDDVNFSQILAEAIFMASASVSGLYYRIMSDAAHIAAVDGTRTGIEHRVKLECEREQQEQLLLSVIPACKLFD